MTEQSTPNTLRFVRYAVLAAIGLALVAYPLVRGRQSGTTAVQAPEPQSADAQLARSLEMYQAGRYDDAIKAAFDSLSVRPGSAEAYNNIGVSLLQLRKFDQAEAALNEAVRLKPDFELAKNNLAWLARERPSAQAATDPASYDGQMMRSLAAYQAGRFAESVEAAREALKRNPKSAEAYNNIAAASAAQQKWDDAIVNAEEAIRLKPDFQLAKNNLTWAQRGKAGLK
jgi:tetratricopeptide (TPR) repeat protein